MAPGIRVNCTQNTEMYLFKTATGPYDRVVEKALSHNLAIQT